MMLLWCVLCLPLCFSKALAYSRRCTIPHTPGTDDTPAVHALLANCSTDSQIVFARHVTYNISSPIDFGTLNNVEISILGNLELPQFIPYVQGLVNASTNQRLYWFTARGTNVTLTGNPDDEGWGWVDCHGYNWWLAAMLTAPGGLPLRPHGWALSFSNSVVRYLKVRKPIGWGISISGANVHVHDIRIDASYDLAKPSIFPFNTDGFDVSGPNVLIEKSTIYNGDDCVAVNSGAHNFTARQLTCIGGHGVSISTAGNVSNVLFDQIHSINSLYGTRFKSSLNAVGDVTNVTWSNIRIDNATFPIFATSVYVDQNTHRGQTPTAPPPNSTSTHISGFSWINITGTQNDLYPGDGSCISVPCWYWVANATNSEGVLFQLLNGTATNVKLKNVSLRTTSSHGTVDSMCDPTSFTDGTQGLGFRCRNGPLKMT